jgi:ribosomal protein S18 acetylase RimI-like enzyme
VTAPAAIAIAALEAKDRARWEVLARGYKAFYETVLVAAEYERAWQRLVAGNVVHGLGATLDGALVGIAHYFFHPTVWMADACHLQDLFVDPAVRGRGVARALIEGCAGAARAHGAARLYWHTRASNATARALYDKVARHDGFIRYDHPIETVARR